ncbi:hypothetical protein PLICRDRAFT_261551 [Plicaturopsis crispa FD-325 SS-3]|nr:hypothetical protein PLICRDRAFT_261551 [Plicaturopsis crispa FD-325 SS-3]
MRTEVGNLVPEHMFEAHLETIKRKEPLQAACTYFNVRHAKKANLGKLRAALVRHCVASLHEHQEATSYAPYHFP